MDHCILDCMHIDPVTVVIGFSRVDRFAVSHGIPCVDPKWVHACIAAGHCIPPAEYPCSGPSIAQERWDSVKTPLQMHTFGGKINTLISTFGSL